MSRPKLLDVFDPSLSSGEVAYTRLTSYTNATIVGTTMTVQSPNLTVQDGASLLLNVITSSTARISSLSIGSYTYALKDSAGNSISQVFPLNSRVSVSLDTSRRYAYINNQAIPEGIVLSEDEEESAPATIDADTVGGYSPSSFALRSGTQNVFASSEVL